MFKLEAARVREEGARRRWLQSTSSSDEGNSNATTSSSTVEPSNPELKFSAYPGPVPCPSDDETHRENMGDEVKKECSGASNGNDVDGVSASIGDVQYGDTY